MRDVKIQFIRTLMVLRFALGLFVLAAAIPVFLIAQGGDTRPLLLASQNDSIQDERRTHDLDILSIGGQIVTSPGSGDFFDEYSRVANDEAKIDAYIALDVTGRIWLREEFRLLLQSGYIPTGFIDIYNVFVGEGVVTGIPLVAVTEEFSLTTIPIMGGIQYSPSRSQFTSYISLTAGVGVTSGEWITSVRQLTQGVYFRPTTNSKGVSVSPAARIGAGVDLRFDRFAHERGLFRGIFIEAAYFYLPVGRDFFKEIRTLARGTPDIPVNDDASLNIGGFSLTFGVNLQFLRK